MTGQALLAVALGAALAWPVHAADITRTFEFSATGWFNTPPAPWVDPVIGSVTAVPEPRSLAFMAAGLAAVWLRRWRAKPAR